MNLAEKIKRKIEEAELYRNQGLVNEALDIYRAVDDMIRKNSRIRNRDSLLSKISARIDILGKNTQNLKAPGQAPELSDQARDLIREMFSFDDPHVKGSSSMGGAVSLAEFGQYEQARHELESLFDYDDLRMEAAGNILQYGIRHLPPKELTLVYQQWQADERFSADEIKHLGEILEQVLNDAGRKANAGEPAEPEPAPAASEARDEEIDDEDILDISAIGLPLPTGSRAGEKVELDVNFQNGLQINLVLSKEQKEIINSLETEGRIAGVIFYSPVAIFSGTVYVSAKKEIGSGPKQGDYTVDLRILHIESG
ncbi:MAG: hypothetical protein K9K62_11130 [Desulfobacteraceae bacterium]|nr:hypothetical protein [Desulfobacteraceae bacterium]